MGKHVPMILSAHRNTRALRRLTRPSFCHGIVHFPLVRRDLPFCPNPGIVVPLVPSSDLHPGIPTSFELFERVVGLGVVFLQCRSLSPGNAFAGSTCHVPWSSMLRIAIERPSL